MWPLVPSLSFHQADCCIQRHLHLRTFLGYLVTYPRYPLQPGQPWKQETRSRQKKDPPHLSVPASPKSNVPVPQVQVPMPKAQSPGPGPST